MRWVIKIVVVMAVVLSSVGSAWAQSDSVRNVRAKSIHKIQLYTSVDLNAEGLTNEFISAFYFGKNLDRDLRTRVSNRLDERNRAGFLFDAELTYEFAPGNYHKPGYYLTIGEHSLAELDFRKSFFDLVFFGNEPYTDQFVYFDNMQFRTMSWQQLKAGIFKTIWVNGERHRIGAALGLNIGQQYQSVYLQNASFFTQKDAEFVALDINADLRRTDSTHSGFGSYNGFGFSLDLDYAYRDRKHHELDINLHNLGYINWNQNPDNFNRDTIFRFEGFQVDLFGLNSPVISSNTGDSILNEVMGDKKREAFKTMLPLDFRLNYRYRFKKRNYSLGLETRYLFFTLYRPRICVNAAYLLVMKGWEMDINPQLSYGGYGGLNAGLKLAFDFKKKTRLEIGVSTLDALIAPSKRTGLAGSLMFYQQF